MICGRDLLLSIIHLPLLCPDSPYMFTTSVVFSTNTYQYIIWWLFVLSLLRTQRCLVLSFQRPLHSRTRTDRIKLRVGQWQMRPLIGEEVQTNVISYGWRDVDTSLSFGQKDRMTSSGWGWTRNHLNCVVLDWSTSTGWHRIYSTIVYTWSIG